MVGAICLLRKGLLKKILTGAFNHITFQKGLHQIFKRGPPWYVCVFFDLNYMFAVYNFSLDFVIKRHQSKIMQPVDWGAWGWKMSKMFLYWRSCFCDQQILDCFVCLILLPLGIVHFSSFINIIFCIKFYAHV